MLFKTNFRSLPTPLITLYKNMPNYNRFHVNCYLKATFNICTIFSPILDMLENAFFFAIVDWAITVGKAIKKRSKTSDTKIGAKKFKSDNFAWKNKEKSIIAIAILRNTEFSNTKIIKHFECKYLFRQWIKRVCNFWNEMPTSLLNLPNEIWFFLYIRNVWT